MTRTTSEFGMDRVMTGPAYQMMLIAERHTHV